MDNWYKKARDKNYDIVVYALLIFLYGIGWDFVVDEKIDLWSMVGVISYTIFVMMFFIKGRRVSEGRASGGHLSNISSRNDLMGKIILAAILYGLLLYKLLGKLIIK
ncbi:MAG: hypothetical protein PHH01_02175 [Patescibacteria group bacterium]|nr:hypothetical protein [Patescibacteria group bacterium]MDD5566978.1 hypothetical protein [Patescibacteria group bacterium]